MNDITITQEDLLRDINALRAHVQKNTHCVEHAIEVVGRVFASLIITKCGNSPHQAGAKMQAIGAMLAKQIREGSLRMAKIQ